MKVPWENVERVEFCGEVPLAGPVPDGHGRHHVTHDEVVDALRFGGSRGPAGVVVMVGRGDGGEGRIYVLLESPEKQIPLFE